MVRNCHATLKLDLKLEDNKGQYFQVQLQKNSIQ